MIPYLLVLVCVILSKTSPLYSQSNSVEGDASQIIDVVGTPSQAPFHQALGGQPQDVGSQSSDVSDFGSQGLELSGGMDDSVMIIPSSPSRGGRDRDVSIINISDSSKVCIILCLVYDKVLSFTK